MCVISPSINHGKEYTTMYYLGIPGHIQSMIPCQSSSEYFWGFRKLHCVSVLFIGETGKILNGNPQHLIAYNSFISWLQPYKLRKVMML